MTNALFLDRDGVINEDFGYVCRPEDFKLIDGVIDFCREMQGRGYKIIVITNQSGIARGYYAESDFERITAHMIGVFASAGVTIADVFHCPSLEGPDRKPAPGLFLKAKEKYEIDMAASINIGDKERDLEAGRAAGVGVNILFSEDWQSVIRQIKKHAV